MIKENQRLLNQFNVITDGVSVFFTLLLAFWVRFFLLPGGEISVPFSHYVYLGLALVPIHLFTYASFSLYESFRKKRLYQELGRLCTANVLDMALLQTFLFMFKEVHFSRWTLIFFFLLNTALLGTKRFFLRYLLRHYRQKGYNLKHVLIVGAGPMARRYLDKIRADKELGYHPMGYVSDRTGWKGLDRLGGYADLDRVLERYRPDEVVSAIPAEEFSQTPAIISACEKAGVKLSMIPFYAEYMPSNPQFDDLDGLPLMNIRRIPLDNWGNAFLKRCMDLVGSLLLIVLTSPVMLFAAIGVKLSSPGPVIFRQERIGRDKKPFSMYKFRSMRLNSGQDTGWSRDRDDRKTKFGALIRKCSIDELPQLFNVLKGDMSFVGPRPVVLTEQTLLDLRAQWEADRVRPGITGLAQIKGRDELPIYRKALYDRYYARHLSFRLDWRILRYTVRYVLKREGIREGSSRAVRVAQRRPVRHKPTRTRNR